MLLDDELLKEMAEKYIDEVAKGNHVSDYFEYPRTFPQGCKVISLCGGATRFSGILGAAVEAVRLGYKPDIILGVSAGAIGALPLALGLFNEIQEEGDNLTPSKFFVKGKHPVGKKGKPMVAGLFRVLCGAISLGEQDVRPLLRKIITEELWQKYLSGNYADVIVFSVEGEEGSIQHYHLKKCKTREEAFEKICASSRISPIVQPMYTKNVNGVVKGQIDGGFRVHNPAGYFLRKYARLNVTDLVSVYSRPENFVVIDKEWDKNIFNVTARVIEIATIEVSKGNEREETFEMFKRRGNHTKIFLPPILKETYATGSQLKELRLVAEKEAKKSMIRTYGTELFGNVA